MNFIKKIKSKVKEKQIVKRTIASLAAVAIAATTFVSSFPSIEVEAASSNALELSADDIIAQACLALGTSYKLGTKGVTGSAYTSGKYGSFKSASSLTTLDCSGLVYWTLGSLGLSSSGYSFNNPVPVDTTHWVYTSNGSNITKSSTFKWTYNGVTTTVSPVKAYQKTSTAKIKNGESGYLRYWQIDSSTNIDAGTIIIGRDTDSTSSVYNHMWIYLGEFSSKSDVITYISRITGMSSSEISPYVSDSGTAGNHWRIECTSGKGVVINNGETAKNSSSFTISAIPLVDDGQIVLKKAFDDNGAYGQNSNGNIQITFKVEETNTDEKHTYTVKGTYNVSKGTWTQTKATNSDNVPDVDIGVTSGGSFYFKNIRVFDNGTNVKYKISETVNSGSYEPWGGTTVTLAKHTGSDGTPYRYERTSSNNGTASSGTIVNDCLQTGKIRIAKKLESASYGASSGVVDLTFKVTNEQDTSLTWTIRGKYTVSTGAWTQVSTSVSSAAKKLRTYDDVSLTVASNGVFKWSGLPVYDSDISSKVLTYKITETVNSGNYSEMSAISSIKLATATYNGTKFYYNKTVTNTLKNSGQIILTKTFDEVTGGNAKVTFKVQSCNSSGTVDGVYSKSLTSTYTVSSKTWSTVGSSSSSIYVTSAGKFVFQNLDMYNNGSTTGTVYYKVTETVSSGAYYASSSSSSSYVVTAHTAPLTADSYRRAVTVTNTAKKGKVAVTKSFSDAGAAASADDPVTITFYLINGNTGISTKSITATYNGSTWTTTGSTSSSSDVYFDTSSGTAYFQNLDLYVENTNTKAYYYVYETVSGNYVANYSYSNKVKVTPASHTNFVASTTFTNYPKGSLTIRKVFSGATSDEVGNAVATFTITRSSNGTTDSSFSRTVNITYSGSTYTICELTGLSVYDDDGYAYTYTITETDCTSDYTYQTAASPKSIKLSSYKSSNYAAITTFTNIRVTTSSDATVTKIITDQQTGTLMQGDNDEQLANVYKNLKLIAMINGEYIVATDNGSGQYTYTGTTTDASEATAIYLDSDSTSSTFGYATITDIDSTSDVYFYEHKSDIGLYYALNMTNTTQYDNYDESYAVSTYSDGVRTIAKLTNYYKWMYATFAKVDENGDELTGGSFGLYAAEDIIVDGVTIYAKDELIEEQASDPDNTIISQSTKRVTSFTTALPAVNLNEDEPRLFKYYVQEIEAPEGYVLDETKYEVEWSDSFANYWNNETIPISDYAMYTTGLGYGRGTTTIINYQYEVDKVDENGESLSGAVLQVVDSDGNVVEEWTTTGSAHTLTNVVLEQTYTLHEASIPDGYSYAQDQTFTVESQSTTITMTDKPTDVNINKVSADGTSLSGAELALIDSNGDVLETWTSDGTAYNFSGVLIAGESYTVKEVSAPDGYVVAEDLTFTVPTYAETLNVEMTDKPTTVYLSKTDITGENELEGASLQVLDSDGNVVDEWVSTTEPHYIEGILIASGSYTLHEEVAPDGFVIANDITFTVSDDGSVDVVEMVDDTTKVQITKYDITNGEELEGASLQVLDSDGNVVDEWTSTTEAHYIEGELIAGETHTLHEEAAPNGYVVASDIEFTVSTDGSVDVVEMYDNIMTGTLEVHKTTEGMLNVEGINFVLSGTSDVGVEVELTAVTDENGIATFEAVPIGTYTITEDSETTPYGYLTADAVEVQVYYAETTVQEVYNNEKTGTLEVHKTTEDMTNIEGIDFVLSGTSDSGREIEITATTDANGIAEFENIPIGTCTITEDGDTVPYGYLTADAVEVQVYYA